MNKIVSLSICLSLIYFPYLNSVQTNEVCKLSNIKTLKQLKEKKKTCKKGQKVLLNYDQSLEPETLISLVCDLKHTVINREKNFINTRDKSNKILCVYEPSN